jgi:hypothetical protein
MPHPDDNEPPHAPRERRSNRDLFAALASGFVGTVALLSSMYNVYLQRQQVRAAVWPRLDGREEYGENDYKLFVTNRGVGSAIIQRVRLSLDGRPARSWGDFLNLMPKDLRSQVPTGASLQVWNTHSLIGTLNPGAENQFVEVNDATTLLFMEAGKRMRFEICYCSSLDDCWSWSSDFAGADETVPVHDCHPDPEPFRPQTSEERAVNITELRRAVVERLDGGTARGNGGVDDAGGDATRRGL